MLKITRIEDASGTILHLEGKLLLPWTDEVRRACTAASGGRLRIDLAQVSFVDEAGEHLLHELLREGVEILACTGYVAELLREGR